MFSYLSPHIEDPRTQGTVKRSNRRVADGTGSTTPEEGRSLLTGKNGTGPGATCTEGEDATRVRGRKGPIGDEWASRVESILRVPSGVLVGLFWESHGTTVKNLKEGR